MNYKGPSPGTYKKIKKFTRYPPHPTLNFGNALFY
jgi:hypothetical protein